MKFGTSGLRGLVGEIQGPVATRYAFAFARYLLARNLIECGSRVFIAYDFRPSSLGIASDCARGLERAGLQPISCGAIPTPALAYYAMEQGSPCLMVTGSHIPADRNGIKFYRPDGEIDKIDEAAITQLALDYAADQFDDHPIEIVDDGGEAYELFRARNSTILSPNALSGMKVGVYRHSTVARDLLEDVLQGYGADVTPLGHSDSFIPVDTEAVSQDTVNMLREWTAEHQLDAVVSADGDGDRPLISDEYGEPLRGDLIGLMTAKYLNAKTIVTPITSNSAIETSGELTVIRTKVGSPYVIEAMIAAVEAGQDKVVGFEANGGVLTQTKFQTASGTLIALPTRDSFLPILAALATARRQGQPLSKTAVSFALKAALADRIENYPQDRSFSLIAHFKTSSGNLSQFLAPIGIVQSVNDTDGLRVTFTDQTVVHLRPSGNAPEMRCYVEANDENLAKALLEQSLALLSKWSAPS